MGIIYHNNGKPKLDKSIISRLCFTIVYLSAKHIILLVGTGYVFQSVDTTAFERIFQNVVMCFIDLWTVSSSVLVYKGVMEL